MADGKFYQLCLYCETPLQEENQFGVAREHDKEFGVEMPMHTMERCRDATSSRLRRIQRELCAMIDEFRIQRNNATALLTKSQRAIVNAKMKKRAARRKRLGL